MPPPAAPAKLATPHARRSWLPSTALRRHAEPFGQRGDGPRPRAGPVVGQVAGGSTRFGVPRDGSKRVAQRRRVVVAHVDVADGDDSGRPARAGARWRSIDPRSLAPHRDGGDSRRSCRNASSSCRPLGRPLPGARVAGGRTRVYPARSALAALPRFPRYWTTEQADARGCALARLTSPRRGTTATTRRGTTLPLTAITRTRAWRLAAGRRRPRRAARHPLGARAWGRRRHRPARVTAKGVYAYDATTGIELFAKDETHARLDRLDRQDRVGAGDDEIRQARRQVKIPRFDLVDPNALFQHAAAGRRHADRLAAALRPAHPLRQRRRQRARPPRGGIITGSDDPIAR